MTTPRQTGSLKNWEGAATIPLQVLALNYDIPRDELNSFRDYVRVYRFDATIIREGDTDRSLYLLRAGTVGIYRKIGNNQEQIATIEAVNFVGEMSLINAEPRSATVKTVSKEAVVYAITQPNLNLILGNPKWAELLISRLSKNLAHNNAQMVAEAAAAQQLRNDIERLHTELATQKALNARTVLLAQAAIDAILRFQVVTRDLAIVGSKGWIYLKTLNEMTKALARHYLPTATVSEKNADIDVLKKCLQAIQDGDLVTQFDDLFNGLS